MFSFKRPSISDHDNTNSKPVLLLIFGRRVLAVVLNGS